MARLQQNLTKIAAMAPQAASKALLQTAADVVDLTKQLAPVDTGELRDSYGADPIDSHTIRVGSDVLHSIFQEYGTVNMPSQPHLIPAMVRSQNIFFKRLQDAVKEINGVS